MMNKLTYFIIFLLFSWDVYGQSTNDQTSKFPTQRIEAFDKSTKLQSAEFKTITDQLDKRITADKSGDLNLDIPIINIQSRSLSIPISASYHSGVKINQRSSEIGLGWNINFGTITRDYGAFEPDYSSTAAECDMKSSDPVSPTFADGSMSISQNSIYFSTIPGSFPYRSQCNPFLNSKNVIYSGMDGANQVTPDLYIVNIPGKGSNSFWNKAPANSASVDFVFTEQVPWKISFQTETFNFDNELTDINEAGIGSGYNPMGSFIPPGTINWPPGISTGSWANAIGFLPYVPDKYAHLTTYDFQTTAHKSDYISGYTFDASGNLVEGNRGKSKICYNDYSSFTITTEDGTRYIFTKQLREQKYLMSEDPFWSTFNYANYTSATMASHSCVGEFWKTDYIKEWCLTSIESEDYFDRNGDGYSVDDAGDWIKIDYVDVQQFNIPPIHITTVYTPSLQYKAYYNNYREWLNYSQTDVPSSLLREKAYIKKIITPLKEYNFVISEKYDIDQDYFQTPENRIGALAVPAYAYVDKVEISKINFPNELKKYDQIVIKNLITDNVETTIQFNYAPSGSSDELCVSDYFIRDKNKEEKDEAGNDIPYLTNWDIENYKKTNSNNKRGRLTLLGIDFYPGTNTSSSNKLSYSFEYAYNPTLTEIHKREIVKMKLFPNVRQSFSLGENYCPYTYSYTYRDPHLGTPGEYSSNYDYSIYPYNCRIWLDGSNSVNLENTGHIFEDELGYYYDPAEPVCNGRHAWSLTKVNLPEGGNVSFEYEKDNFDYANDKTHWNIKDDDFPIISRYNYIAQQRSIEQHYKDYHENNDPPNPVGGNPNPYYHNMQNANAQGLTKTLYSCFEMKMNQSSGGIRLKSKRISGCNSNPETINYTYGTGHFQSVPASYWSNNIAAFGEFITAEHIRHHHEMYLYDPAFSGGSIIAGMGADGTPFFTQSPFPHEYVDFDYRMGMIPVSTRLDNTVSDSHYYEYIQENFSDGGSIKQTYICPSINGVDYKSQKWCLLKGFPNTLNTEKATGIFEETDLRTDPILSKTEYFINGNSLAISSEDTHFEFESTTEGLKIISTKQLPDIIGLMFYPLYRYSIVDLSSPNSAFELLPTAMQSFISDQFDVFLNSLDGKSIADQQAAIANEGFPISAQTVNIRQSIWKRVNQKVIMKDNVTTTSTYTYGNSIHMQPTTILANSSDGKQLKTKIKYNSEFDSPTINTADAWALISMKNKNNVVVPVETITSQVVNGTEQIVSANLNLFYDFLIDNEHYPKPWKVYSLDLSTPILNTSFNNSYIDNTSGAIVFDNRYRLLKTYQSYDNYLNLESSKVEGDITHNYLFVDYGRIKTGEFINAERNRCDFWGSCTNNNYSFCSFEARESLFGVDHEDGFYTDPIYLDLTEKHSGVRSLKMSPAPNPGTNNYTINAQRYITPKIERQFEKYILSAWIKTDANFPTNSGAILVHFSTPQIPMDEYNAATVVYSLPISNTFSSWKYYELSIDLNQLRSQYNVASTDLITLEMHAVNYVGNHTYWIDDILFKPNSSIVTTYTYDPIFNFVSSATDGRNSTTFYEYDEMGRSTLMRDQNQCILKANSYNIMLPCGN